MKDLKKQLEEEKAKASKLPNADRLLKSIEEKLKYINKPIKK